MGPPSCRGPRSPEPLRPPQHTPLGAPGLYIQTLLPGSPAAADGRLSLGDRILEVNGSSLMGVSYLRYPDTPTSAWAGGCRGAPGPGHLQEDSHSDPQSPSRPCPSPLQKPGSGGTAPPSSVGCHRPFPPLLPPANRRPSGLQPLTVGVRGCAAARPSQPVHAPLGVEAPPRAPPPLLGAQPTSSLHWVSERWT